MKNVAIILPATLIILLTIWPGTPCRAAFPIPNIQTSAKVTETSDKQSLVGPVAISSNIETTIPNTPGADQTPSKSKTIQKGKPGWISLSISGVAGIIFLLATSSALAVGTAVLLFLLSALLGLIGFISGSFSLMHHGKGRGFAIAAVILGFATFGMGFLAAILVAALSRMSFGFGS